MFVLTWSKDFETGNETIDNQHKTLFETINLFSFRAQSHLTNMDLVLFIDELNTYANYHFSDEERMMAEMAYPFLDQHKKLHEDLIAELFRLRGLLLKNEIEEPVEKVIRFSSDWLNHHIKKDDFAFFSYSRQKDKVLDKNFEGSKCELSSLHNKILGIGIITSVTENEIVISNSGKNAPKVNLNDLVKVVLVAPDLTRHGFVARVLFSTRDTIRLFHAKFLESAQEKKFLKAKIALPGELVFGDDTFPINVTHISVGGAKVTTNHTVSLGSLVTLKFELLDYHMNIPCEITKIVQDKFVEGIQYSCTFASLTQKQFTTIAELQLKENLE